MNLVLNTIIFSNLDKELKIGSNSPMIKFDRIYIEISNVCNLACSFCPEVERPKKIMAPDDFKSVLSQIDGHTELITLHLMGEPLLHPHLAKIFEEASLKNLKINLTTNGILLKKKLEDFVLQKSFHQINFSLQSFPDNFKDKSFDEYLDEILFYVDDIMMRRPDVYINFRLWNEGTVEEETTRIFIINKIESRYKINLNPNVDVGFKKSKRIINKFYLHFDSRFDWPNIDGPDFGEKGFCHGLKTHVGIHADGTVVPCCLDKEAKIKLGNILEGDDFSKVINNEKSSKIRNSFQKKEVIEDLCRHCSYRLRFNK